MNVSQPSGPDSFAVPGEADTTSSASASRIYAEQVRLIYDQGLRAAIAAPVAAVLLVAVLWPAVSHTAALIWLLGAIPVGAFRFHQNLAYRRRTPAPDDARAWGRRFVLGSAIAGGYFGIGAVVLFPQHSPASQFVEILVFSLIAMTYAYSFSALKSAYFAVATTTLGPLAVALAMQPDYEARMFAVGIVAFGAFLALYMLRVNRLILGSLRLSFENLDLVHYLAASKVETEGLNERLRESRSLLESTLEASADGIASFDVHGRLATWNRKFLDMWQLNGDDESLTTQGLVRHLLHRLARPTAAAREALRTALHSDQPIHVELEFKDGTVYEARSEPQLIDDRRFGRVWSFHDITESRRVEARLAHLAHYDSLTGLPNRALFFDRLHQAVRRAHREGSHFALLYVDLDGFKQVNDHHGHEAGDKLLETAGRRLMASLRASDTAARVGGDEFVVILESAGDREKIAALASTIGETLSADRGIAASIGVALYPADATSPEALLSCADAAMYAAKADPGVGVKFYRDREAS